jgi:r-opsin
MVVIGYDRYNVIVKGFSGKRITPVIAFIVIVSIWLYSSAVCCPPFIGWGGYMLEGLFMTCSYDYLSEDWNRKSFILYAFIFNYCFPMFMVIFYYTQIVRAVVKHESALKAQAKKMNVESLRSNQVCNNQFYIDSGSVQILLHTFVGSIRE